MHPALQAMLVTPIPHAAYTGQDAYGKPSYGAPVTEMARVEFRIRRVPDQSGVERISRARVFLDGSVVIDIKNKLTLPDGTEPPIIALYAVLDDDGSRHHWECWF